MPQSGITSLRLDDETKEKIQKVVEIFPTNKSTFMKEAIKEKADEMLEYAEIIKAVKEIKAGKAETYTNKQMRERYGL